MTDVGVAEFFAGRYVLVTGATGFMGKVLVEKLVRSCPGLAGVYILVRTKRGEDPQRRLDKILGLPLFDLVREEAARKVVVVPGDLKLLGLGLTPAWTEELKERVSVIFHSAATVRFNDPLKESVLLNTRGTRELVNLALDMPQLAVFLHVSTTYCNVDRDVIGEQVYPPHADWRETIRIVEQADEAVLRVMTPKYINSGPRALPNTYTFAKSLAEQVINDHADHLPSVIFRPSIVIATDSEPVAGWIDNFNGPVGMMVGAAKGVVHIALADKDTVADYIPVDWCIKAILVAAWKKAMETGEEKKKVTVYNAATSAFRPVTMSEMSEIGYSLLEQCPVGKAMWVPAGIVTPLMWLYYLGFMVMHVLPALIVDTALTLVGHKFRLMRVYRKLYNVNTALSFFSTRTWHFENGKLLLLDKEIPEKDREAFSFIFLDRTPKEYFEKVIYGGRRYLLKEPDHTLPADRAHMKRIIFLSKFVKYALIVFVIYSLLGYVHDIYEALSRITIVGPKIITNLQSRVEGRM